jgi:hypothetical protein
VLLPFRARFYNVNYSRLIVGSNGTLGVSANGNPATNSCLPSAQFNYAILPLWDDLTTVGTGNGVFTSISGRAPLRVFNIEWRAQRISDGLSVNFEARIFESSTVIQFIYNLPSGGSSSATIGLQRDTGSQFLQIQCLISDGIGPEGGIDPNAVYEFELPPDPLEPTPTACTIEFSDVPSDHTFYAFVRCLACRNVISGYADGTFRPGNDVTRGQLTKMVANALGLNEDPGAQIFEDVPIDSTFYEFIQRLTNRAIIGGYQCGGVGEPCGSEKRPYFRPGNTATRGQTSKIISNAASFEDPVSGQTFEDVPTTHIFYLWIQRLAAYGIIGGYQCGGVGEPCGSENRPYFRPQNNVTRGQTSKIVATTFFPGCITP